MFDVFKKEIEWGGKTLTLETGRIARQADAPTMATIDGSFCMSWDKTVQMT